MDTCSSSRPWSTRCTPDSGSRLGTTSSTAAGRSALSTSSSCLTSSSESSRDGVPADHLGQVRGDDGGALDQGGADGLGGGPVLERHPDGGQPEHGFGGAAAGQHLGRVTDREQVPRRCLAGGHADAADPDLVAAGRQRRAVAGAHGRQHDAEVERGLAAQRPHPVEQVAAAGRVDEVDDVGGEQQLERVDVERFGDRVGSGSPAGVRGGRRRPRRAASGPRLAAGWPGWTPAAAAPPAIMNGSFGMPGTRQSADAGRRRRCAGPRGAARAGRPGRCRRRRRSSSG